MGYEIFYLTLGFFIGYTMGKGALETFQQILITIEMIQKLNKKSKSSKNDKRGKKKCKKKKKKN